jgi:hypothetical protein
MSKPKYFHWRSAFAFGGPSTDLDKNPYNRKIASKYLKNKDRILRLGKYIKVNILFWKHMF